jgi:hypothetical protein
MATNASLPTPERVAELRASLDEIRDRVRSAVSQSSSSSWLSRIDEVLNKNLGSGC